jgi:DNA-binding transcriptional ArsR family regulator
LERSKEDFDSAEKIAELARVFSDPTRVRIVFLLGQESEGASTMDICTRLGLYQPRISSHLAILLKHNIVTVSERGRQRIYSVNPKAYSFLRDLSDVTSDRVIKKRVASRGALKEVRMNSEIRQCRGCYDHLAGVAGVNLLQEMLKLGWLLEEDDENSKKISYKLTERGSSSLRERGVDIDWAEKSKSRKFAYGCLDWTERAPHLGGSLGKAILDSIISRGVVARRKGTRALSITRPISSWTK